MNFLGSGLIIYIYILHIYITGRYSPSPSPSTPTQTAALNTDAGAGPLLLSLLLLLLLQQVGYRDLLAVLDHAHLPARPPDLVLAGRLNDRAHGDAEGLGHGLRVRERERERERERAGEARCGLSVERMVWLKRGLVKNAH